MSEVFQKSSKRGLYSWSKLHLKMKRNLVIILSILFIAGIFLYIFKGPSPTNSSQLNTDKSKIISGSFDKSKIKTDDEWKKILTSQQYNILRQAGTEIPFTGVLDHETRKGTYYSVGCNEPVFRSEQKYDS